MEPIEYGILLVYILFLANYIQKSNTLYKTDGWEEAAESNNALIALLASIPILILVYRFM